MTDKIKPFLVLDMRCCCGASLFVECPQEASYSLANDLVRLSTSWSQSHGHHGRTEQLDQSSPKEE